MNVGHGIHQEISTFDHLFADLHLLLNIPSEGDTIDDNSLRLSGTGIEDRQFIVPPRDRDRSELLVECRGGRIVDVARKQGLDLLLALLFPLWVDGEVDEGPASLLE